MIAVDINVKGITMLLTII